MNRDRLTIAGYITNNIPYIACQSHSDVISQFPQLYCYWNSFVICIVQTNRFIVCGSPLNLGHKLLACGISLPFWLATTNINSFLISGNKRSLQGKFLVWIVDSCVNWTILDIWESSGAKYPIWALSFSYQCPALHSKVEWRRNFQLNGIFNASSKSFTRWRFVTAAFPHVMHCAASMIQYR